MTIYEARTGDIQLTCPVCLKRFWAFRRSKIYCGDTCRQRAHRKPALEDRLKELSEDAQYAITGLIAVQDRSGMDGFRAQQRLKALFFQIVNNADDKTRRVLYEAIKDDLYRVLA